MNIIGVGYESIPICGVYDDTRVTHWLNALVGKSISEGMVIMDYGCGNGRLSHYLSKRLEGFTYYGIEVDSDHGRAMVEFARTHFSDPRTSFGLTGSEIEEEAINSATLAAYGSVFTHTTIEETYSILDRHRQIVDNGGSLVFSTLLDQKYSKSEVKAYYEDGWAVVYNTLDQYLDYADKNNLVLSTLDIWDSGNPREVHTILEMKK